MHIVEIYVRIKMSLKTNRKYCIPKKDITFYAFHLLDLRERLFYI